MASPDEEAHDCVILYDDVSCERQKYDSKYLCHPQILRDGKIKLLRRFLPVSDVQQDTDATHTGQRQCDSVVETRRSQFTSRLQQSREHGHGIR